MPERLIPVTLLTGFLGSGKTTLLNHLVRRPELERTLVVINEFGEVGLDHLLMTRVADSTVVELSSGCLCCTVRGDLVSTLKDAHWRFSRGGSRQFDRVVIETTGLADPAPIIQTLTEVTVIARRYRLDGIITTLDLGNAERTLDAQPEAVKQAAVADCLLLTKSDLAPPDAIVALERRLAAINPAAPRLIVEHGSVDPEAILGLGLFDPSRKTPDVARWLNEAAYGDRLDGDAGHELHHDHDHDHAPGHHHDRNRHDDRIRAFCLVVDRPMAEGMVQAWLDLLLSQDGANVLRIKGLLNLQGHAAPVVLQGVQHVLHPLVELPAWPDHDRRSKIVLITRDIPRETVEASLAAFIDAW